MVTEDHPPTRSPIGEDERAAERARAVAVEGAEEAWLAALVREHVARVAPSPLDNGGGALRVRCTPALERDPEGGWWRLVIEGDYAGALPSADPPWRLDAELIVTLDARGHLREHARIRWETA